MAPGDRGLKWEGQVLGDRDMTIYFLPGGFSSSLTHPLTHDHFFHNQEVFFFFPFFFFSILTFFSHAFDHTQYDALITFSLYTGGHHTERYTMPNHTSLSAG